MYGYSRTQAIDHTVDLIYQAGFNHIRHGFIADNSDSDVTVETSVRCHQLGMTFSLARANNSQADSGIAGVI